MTSEPYHPPLAYIFGVWLGPGVPSRPQNAMDAIFNEVSGIDPYVSSEEFVEGGANAYVHQLPGALKPQNLVLKRGQITQASALAQWAEQTVGSTLDAPISTSTLNVSLLGPNMQAMVTWSFQNAWPVNWKVSESNTMRNELWTETLEIAYTIVTRTIQN